MQQGTCRGQATKPARADHTGQSILVRGQAPTLNAQWTSYGDVFALAGYRRDAGCVQLRGLVKAGSGDAVVFVLSAGFRPPAQQIYMAVSDSSTPARIDVRASGEILVSQPGAGALGWLSLDGITFFAE